MSSMEISSPFFELKRTIRRAVSSLTIGGNPVSTLFAARTSPR